MHQRGQAQRGGGGGEQGRVQQSAQGRMGGCGEQLPQPLQRGFDPAQTCMRRTLLYQEQFHCRGIHCRH